MQLATSRGFDHSLLLTGRHGGHGGHLTLAACLEDPVTGRVFEVQTDQLAVHLYTGNMLDGSARATHLPAERRSVPRDAAPP